MLGVTVELVQLTGLPARVGDLWAPARLVLGSTFVPRDLAVAVAGATLAALTDRLTRRGSASSPPRVTAAGSPGEDVEDAQN